MFVHTLRGFDANLLEALSLLHRPDNSLNQLLNLFVQASDVRVLFRGLLVNLHCLHSAVVLRGQGIKNKVRILIHTDKIAWLELLVIYEADEGQKDGLSCRCLDDCRLAYSGGVEIDVCAFLSRLF